MGNVNEPKVGDTFYLVEDGANSGRYARNNNKPYDTFIATVAKVGRKYFTLSSGWREIKVEIGKTYEDSNRCKDYSIWSDKEEYEQYKYRKDLVDNIQSYHRKYGDIYKDIATDDIVAIAKILKIEV